MELLRLPRNVGDEPKDASSRHFKMEDTNHRTATLRSEQPFVVNEGQLFAELAEKGVTPKDAKLLLEALLNHEESFLIVGRHIERKFSSHQTQVRRHWLVWIPPSDLVDLCQPSRLASLFFVQLAHLWRMAAHAFSAQGGKILLTDREHVILFVIIVFARHRLVLALVEEVPRMW